MKLYSILLSLFLSFSVISCDFNWGGCPKIQYELDNFELNRIEGKWFEVVRSNSIPFEKGNCVDDTYTINNNGSFNVTARQVLDGVETLTYGRAEPTENPFRFRIGFEPIARFVKGDYQIVNTDYDNFLTIYSCSDLYFARLEFIWVMSRKPNVSQELLSNYTTYLSSKFNIQSNTLFFANRTLCHDE
jgi:lipocalin